MSQARIRLVASSFLVFIIIFSFYLQLVSAQKDGDLPEGNQTNTEDWYESATDWWKRTFGWFFDAINAIWNGLVNVCQMIVNSLTGIGRIISESWNMFWSFWGNWGHPALYTEISLANLQGVSADPTTRLDEWAISYIRNVANRIKTMGSQEQKKIAEQLLVDLNILEVYKKGDTSRINVEALLKEIETLCQALGIKREIVALLMDERTVADITSSGVLGLFSYIFFVLTQPSTWQIVVFILQNFILIHAVAITALLVGGVYMSFQKRDFEPLMKTVQFIAGYFKIYVNLMSWILARTIDLAQAIAQWLDTIIPF